MNGRNASGTQGQKRRLTGREIEDLLGRYKTAGLKQREFAQRHGVPLSSLQYWLRQARNGNPQAGAAAPARKGSRRPGRSGGPAAFVEVDLKGGLGPELSPVRYEIRHGDWVVVLPEGFSRESLSVLLESIRGQ